ncbi:hypothetical protein AWV80_01225 [Cupriavidus sp. UYMU48A]|nr:hypothetical protein AWV80_01225 [Cupriavidus sp. UYMU48A]
MARRSQVQLALNAGAGSQTGVDWPGGRGLLMVDATFGGGNVVLEQQSPAGKWLGINHECTTTPISVTANGTAYFAAPAGPIRVTITTASAVNAHAIGIPSNNGG